MDADVEDLSQAFAVFTAATTRLEREYTVLRERVIDLTREVEEKNRRLAVSDERARALEADLVRQGRLAAMGEMAAMLAHEVRNPLGAMELFTGLLLQDLQGHEGPRRLAEQVARGIADLSRLVTNLLEFARPTDVTCVAVDPDALLDDAIALAGVPESVTTMRRCTAPGVAAAADGSALRSVLLNLVRNAVQAMPDGGTLELGVHADAAKLAIVVGDTGPGIPRDQFEAIFRPFVTTRAKGTGLGLSVSRQLVQAMGGRLTVASTVGAGARFTVTLRRWEERG